MRAHQPTTEQKLKELEYFYKVAVCDLQTAVLTATQVMTSEDEETYRSRLRSKRNTQTSPIDHPATPEQELMDLEFRYNKAKEDLRVAIQEATRLMSSGDQNGYLLQNGWTWRQITSYQNNGSIPTPGFRLRF